MSLVFDVPFVAPSFGIDRASFMEAMTCLASPVSVITTLASDGRPVGATLSAVSSLSLDPPLFLACFDDRSETLRALRAHRRYLVHILSAEQQDIARRFASKSADKFREISRKVNSEGLPQLAGCCIVLRCRLFNVQPGGDHSIVSGEVEGIEDQNDAVPMIYHARRMTRQERSDA